MKSTIQDALDERGYDALTPVQEAVLDPALAGRDLLVSAQTGSGKTLGFALAIAPTILGDADVFEEAGAPLALVIAPTRELALQVKRELTWVYEKAGGRLASCVGGMDIRDERRALVRGAHIVAATPGRLRDHITRGAIDLSNVRAIVLDEADEMLDLGFREELEFILGEAPEERQTLLFSATVPPAIAGLAKAFQRDAERVIAKSKETQHSDIEYRAMRVADGDLDNAVINTLRYYEAPNAIVFANTRAAVNRLAARLSNRGFQAVALSGELSQSERTHALQAMRDGRAQVCVATDVAARGIDLPKLDLVVHAELPSNQETLLHRSGRTGRAGRKGVSALMVTPRVRKKAERILGWAKVKAEWSNAPSAAEVRARDEDRLFADPAWTEEIAEADGDIIARMLDTFAPEQIAAGYLRMLHTLRAPPEELGEVTDKPKKPREEFGPSVWFAVSGGRDAGAEPRRLLPMMCKAGGLTKDDIGAIRVQNDRSLVQVRQGSVEMLLKSVGEAMVLEEGATLTQLDEAPVFEKRGPKPGGKPHRGGPRGDRPGGPRGDRPRGDRKWDDKPKGDRPYKDGPRKEKSWGDKPRTDKPRGDKPWSDKPRSDKPRGDKPWSDKPKGDRPRGDKPAYGKPKFDKTLGDKPWDDKPRGKGPKGDGPKRGKRDFDNGDGPRGDKRAKPKWDQPKDGDAKPRRPHGDWVNDPSAKPMGAKGGKRKGQPPPKGKPSSKKNRARAEAAGKPGKRKPS